MKVNRLIKLLESSMVLKNILIVSVVVGSLFSADWHYSKNEDRMTGKKSFFVIGESVDPLNKMDFPYADTKSRMGFRCADKSQSVSFIFNVTPNLSRSKTKDGYSQVTVPIKVDDTLYLVYLKQRFGSKFLTVAKRKYKSDGYEVIDNVDSFIKTISKSKKVLMQIGWHGNGGVYFEYDTNGLKENIEKMQKECGI
jgi:hypothetical protein